MSKEVKRYVCHRGEMVSFEDLASSNIFQYVDADDYEALLAERDALRDENANLQTRLTGMTFDRNCRMEERDALKKDAERYRWLRLQASRTHSEIGEVPSQYRDQFIDAALQGEQPCSQR